MAPIRINFMPGICWWYLFHKEMKRSFSTAPDIFKPPLKCSIFKCISWLNGSFFGGEQRGCLNEGVKTYRMAPMSPLNSPTSFCLHIYSLRFHKPHLERGHTSGCSRRGAAPWTGHQRHSSQWTSGQSARG